MPPALPEQIWPLRLARQRSGLAGALEVRGLARFSAALHDASGIVEVALEFGREDGLTIVRGRLSTSVTLTCQRCMGPMPQDMQVEVATRLVMSDAELADTRSELECLRLDDDGSTALAVIVEDELLLSLPPYPRHATAECPVDIGAYGPPPEEPRKNPFAVLAELKHDN